MATPTTSCEIRNEVLLSWHPIVQRIANRAAAAYGLPQGVEPGDLVSCGILGLAEAWERFDPDRGVAFEAFAMPRVKGAIVDAIRAGGWVPRKARERARATGEPLVLVVSLDQDEEPRGHRSPACNIADADAPVPGAAVIAADDRVELLRALNALPEREREIISLHYFEGVQLAHIAGSMGVTESRVSQLHRRALRMLRERLLAVSADKAGAA